jgi:hypothetical protein
MTDLLTMKGFLNALQSKDTNNKNYLSDYIKAVEDSVSCNGNGSGKKLVAYEKKEGESEIDSLCNYLVANGFRYNPKTGSITNSSSRKSSSYKKKYPLFEGCSDNYLMRRPQIRCLKNKNLSPRKSIFGLEINPTRKSFGIIVVSPTCAPKHTVFNGLVNSLLKAMKKKNLHGKIPSAVYAAKMIAHHMDEEWKEDEDKEHNEQDLQNVLNKAYNDWSNFVNTNPSDPKDYIDKNLSYLKNKVKNGRKYKYNKDIVDKMAKGEILSPNESNVGGGGYYYF